MWLILSLRGVQGLVWFLSLSPLLLWPFCVYKGCLRLLGFSPCLQGFSRISFVEFRSIFCFVVVFVYPGECPLYPCIRFVAFSFLLYMLIYPKKRIMEFGFFFLPFRNAVLVGMQDESGRRLRKND